jgi:hypothetical protein
VPETLLREASEVLNAELDGQAACERSIKLVDISPPAFAEFLEFLYHLEKIDILDHADIIIEVCAIADRWQIRRLHNQSLDAFEGICDWLDEEDLRASANKVYKSVSKHSPQRKYVAMRLAFATLQAQDDLEDNFSWDIEDFLGKQEDENVDEEDENKAKCRDYYEQLVRLVLHNAGKGKGVKELSDLESLEPIPLKEYLLE